MVPSLLQRFLGGGKEGPNPRTSDMRKLMEADPFFQEQVKALRAKLEFRAEGLGKRVIAVTSAISGEGKTVLTGKLARSMASAGCKKVVLVGVDMRKSDLAGSLGLASLPGLTEYLAGSVPLERIVRTTDLAGLHVVPPGIEVADPTDLIGGARFREFLGDLRRRYDYVLVDTPPVLPVSDTLLLRDQVDAFLLLYRANWTPNELFRQAVDEIGENMVLGVVLNAVEMRSNRYYDKYYGEYYRQSRPRAAERPVKGTG